MRRMDEHSTEDDQIKFRTAAAHAITRLNEARIDGRDVMFLCTCIVKTRDHLVHDNVLLESQRDLAVSMCNTLVNKLQGVGTKHFRVDA